MIQPVTDSQSFKSGHTMSCQNIYISQSDGPSGRGSSWTSLHLLGLSVAPSPSIHFMFTPELGNIHGLNSLHYSFLGCSKELQSVYFPPDEPDMSQELIYALSSSGKHLACSSGRQALWVTDVLLCSFLSAIMSYHEHFLMSLNAMLNGC